MHHILWRIFWQNIKSPRWLSSPKTQIWCPVTSGFFPLKRKRSSDHRWDLGKHNRAADGNWENCVNSQRTYIEGVIVLCTVFLVSSSINVSIFHITWLDTFWTDILCFLTALHPTHGILKDWTEDQAGCIWERPWDCRVVGDEERKTNSCIKLTWVKYSSSVIPSRTNVSSLQRWVNLKVERLSLEPLTCQNSF